MVDSCQMDQYVRRGASLKSAFDGRGPRGPLVSVLLPTYNRRRYLPYALKSILQQTYGNLEIFVLRDGGQDVSDIVRQLDDPRVVFINKGENRGKPHCLNEALARAQGKYVAYLDDDDVYYPQHVQVLVDVLERQTDCHVAYSDLYKVYCNVLPNGDRQVLSKHVEISRDFDRFLMLYFNHVLHVSLMHRRDLLDKTGLYNENLNILIDWDMTRRLAFFSDFHHVHTITGEFYSPISMCDRISVQRRRDGQEYLRNILEIRSTKPAKPWPKLAELSIIVVVDRADEDLARILMRIWRYTFYPCQLYVPLPRADIRRLNIEMPNVTLVPVHSSSSSEERLDVALEKTEGQYVAVVSGGSSIDEMWVEHAVYALMNSNQDRIAYRLEDQDNQTPAIVISRRDLAWARKTSPHLSLHGSLASTGVRVRTPEPQERPFQFDDMLRDAKWAEGEGNWAQAGELFELAAVRYRNELWMKAMAARAYFEAGNHSAADRLSREVNDARPTVDTLLLEAMIRQKRGDYVNAIRLLNKAEQWLDGGIETPILAAAPMCSMEADH